MSVVSSYDKASQAARRKQVLDLYLAEMREAVGPNGEWRRSGQEQGVREKLWHCLALLRGGSDDIALANQIIASLPIPRCHFSPMTSMQLLLRHEQDLTAEVVSKLEAYVKESLPFFSRDVLRYTMYNDNFAGMAMFTLLTAGERFGDRQVFELGVEKLKGLQEVFMRNGTIMEYGSPTYTVVDLHAIAEVVNHVQDTQVRALAAKCEERMWAEIVTHYHAPSAMPAGPYSRAYTVDMVGHPHQLHYVMYHVFGDAVFINPVANLFMPRENQVIHVGLDTLMWPNLVWLICGDYHCPDYLAELAFNKPNPFTVITRSECLPSRIEGYRTDPQTGERQFVSNILEFAGFSGPNTTYMTDDYALGTAYSQFHDGGLTESFYVVYRKKRPATDLADTGVVFARYIINDKVPEQTNQYAVYGEMGPHIFRDEGRKFGMQHGSCSLMVYKPKQFEAAAVSSMKLSVVLPCHFGFTPEIMINGKWYQGSRSASETEASAKASDLTGGSSDSTKQPLRVLATSDRPCPVYVKDGPVYIAFKPLTLTDHGTVAPVKVEQRGHYLYLSFYNYEGPSRSFEVEEMLLTSSGFIAHIGSSDDWDGFDSFVKYAEEGALSDRVSKQEGSVTRWIRYTRRDLDMHFAYSPLSEGIMIETINGRPRPTPIFQASGLDSRRLPFLEDWDG